MHILNIAGYEFTELSSLETLQSSFLTLCERLELKGTILLSVEGINLNLSGTVDHIASFKQALIEQPAFLAMTFRESFSDSQPFKFMRVKIKPEIISMRQPNIHPETERAPSISPKLFKQWLDEKRDMTVLDTRNAYEFAFGTFDHAEHLAIDDFSEFPQAAKKIQADKPIVMFCTGGIRCEKAALSMLQAGYSEVYQLDGGILNYFSEVGGEHYHGECFVFDQRIALDPHLNVTGTRQCLQCQGPIIQAEQLSSENNCTACSR